MGDTLYHPSHSCDWLTVSINVYTGLQGSGKSYEVVAEVIVPAIANGRRVVTNVDGIDAAKIVEYIKTSYSPVPQLFGEVVHVTNGDVSLPTFFPFYDNDKGAHTDTVVQPGDLVCIDEAWRFWPATGAKLLTEHKSFFLEHRHFTNPDTDVACDLVLMIQDMSTLNRFIKNVVAFSGRTHKKISIGLPSRYSVTMYEGSKQTKAAEMSTSIRKYRAEVYALYSSFKGGAEGKIVNVDKRQNMLANKNLWVMIGCVALIGIASVVLVYRFFHHGASEPVNNAAAKANATTAATTTATNATKPPNAFSDTWRIVGNAQVGINSYVLIADGAGRLRYESPSMFVQAGPQTIGTIDGAKVTYYSGQVVAATGSIKK